MHLLHFHRPAAWFVLIAGLACGPTFAASQNSNLPNFQKVDEHVYRGAQPELDGFKDLAAMGVKTVIDLRQIGEHSQADEQKAVTAQGMRYISIPMKGLSEPKDDLVAQVEAIFNDPSAGPVFVHCKRGADRTGMVVAVYRISRDGWDNKRALKEAKSYGMSIFERAIQHYISDYKPSLVEVSSSSGAASHGTSQ